MLAREVATEKKDLAHRFTGEPGETCEVCEKCEEDPRHELATRELAAERVPLVREKGICYD